MAIARPKSHSCRAAHEPSLHAGIRTVSKDTKYQQRQPLSAKTQNTSKDNHCQQRVHLDGSIIVDQDIGWLDISMHGLARVFHVVQPANHGGCNLAEHGFWELLRCRAHELDDVLQVGVATLHKELDVTLREIHAVLPTAIVSKGREARLRCQTHVGD